MALLGITWNVARMGAEIPSGVLADKWGRKKTIFLSQLFLIADLITTIFTHTFWLFMLSTIFSGFWFTCYSGTGVAFFYDTLLGLNREKDYENLWGKMGFLNSCVSFVAAFSAGFLFMINIIFPYVLAAILAFLSLFVVLSFVEPKFHKPAEEQSVFLHFKESINKVARDEYIAFIVIFGAILSFALDYLFTNGQLYLNSIKVPIVFFGIIFAFSAIIEGIGGTSANKIKNKFNYRNILTFTLLISICIIFGLSFLNNFYGIFVFLLLNFMGGLFRIIQRGYIHKRVDSYNRATVDSVSTFTMTIIVIIFAPIAGLIADIYSIRLSFFLVGCILTLYAIY